MAQTLSPGRTPFSIDPDAGMPVGLQLTWRLRALITTGRLASGERLPSFRQLADWAGVNVNTVRAVYAGLEEEGLVVSRQGLGTFVAEGIQAAPQLEEIVGDALRRAEEAGLSATELAIVASACAGMRGAQQQQLEDAAAPHAAPDPTVYLDDEPIEVRQELRRQIGRLEAELASYTRDLPEGMRTAHGSATAHIAGVEELEQTRDTLIARLSEAQKAAEDRAREEARARGRRESTLDPARADPPADSGPGPLAKAMSWWRDKA